MEKYTEKVIIEKFDKWKEKVIRLSKGSGSAFNNLFWDFVMIERFYGE